jgi:hypothetical protein
MKSGLKKVKCGCAGVEGNGSGQLLLFSFAVDMNDVIIIFRVLAANTAVLMLHAMI